ncbi:MAG: ATP-binding protein [Leptolyngbyaceae cyanobacterium bins.349]|nr:ATP-binding protein [Leptolyngbyaceae cyanobacterium bins.349]
MSLHRVYLSEFVQSVPTVTGQESLAIGLNRLHRHPCDRLVVVDADHHPLGLIQLHDLLPFVLETATPEVTSAQVSQTMTRSLLELTPSVVSPLMVLPEQWTVDQFLATTAVLDQPYALVNQEARLVGLLDRDRLLHRLAAPLRHRSASINNMMDHDMAETSVRPPLNLGRDELSQSFAEFMDGPARASSPSRPLPAATPLTPVSLLNVLLQLLERLPLPLMLQTSEGSVVAQNLVWCQQVGALSDPGKVWREASVWLGTSAAEPPATAPYGADITPIRSELTLQPTAIAPLPLPQEASPDSQSLCQLGTHPDSCVCVCALKDGREQVVQFVKISLSTLLPDLNLDWLPRSPSPAASRAMSFDHAATVVNSFQLATLAPDPQEAASAEARQQGEQTRSLTDSVLPGDSSLESLWLVMAQDVTQQQHLARELTAKNADLVQLNRLKDEFLACISHELKTPLTAVLGLSSLLKDQTLGKLNQRQVHYAQLIYQSSRHLMGVVNDILDLTRIETGQLELLYSAIDIPVLCQRAFEQAKQLRASDSKNFPPLEEDEITPDFCLEIEPALGTLIADDLRLRQMLVHLLSNSLKFTEDDKPIGLKVSRWGGWVAFTVWDAGIGIPAEKQHLIFQKFQQLENPLTRRFEGAGLGLVLTRRLARLHGGDVTFVSREGAGSQFTILLPPTPPDKTQLTRNSMLDDAAAMQVPTMSYPSGRVPVSSYPGARDPDQSLPLSPHARDRLVLIVDAVPQFVESLMEKLTGMGYRAVVARSGTEALEKARRLQPCVIFLNPLLPLLSGWDVLTLLKSGTETQHLPVVVTATVIDEDRAHQNQADGFLKLPVQTQKLQAVLQQFVVSTREPIAPVPTTPQTILHLFCAQANDAGMQRSLDLDELLRSRQYRILEADDLSQAEMLASVWRPNVVLLEGAIANPTSYLQQLSGHSVLASLPLVVLDVRTAQIANQIAGLQVFPCLLNSEPAIGSNTPELSTLLQVIQIAAGCVWQPSILAVDMSSLPSGAAATGMDQAGTISPSKTRGNLPKETEWLRALMQYLQTAGMEGLIGQSWSEVMQQISSQSVDVLLLCWTHGEPHSETLEMLAQLRDRHPKPPIIVLDHRDPELGETTLIPLPEQVRELATQILSPPIAMSELLEQIQKTIHP